VTTAIRDELRRRLTLADEAPEPALTHVVEDGETAAAVLVPLFLHDGELHAVFTKRRDDLRRHPGEISFPGGRRDHEREALHETALREAEEEIGLPPDTVELLGTLEPVKTFVTSYVIFPYVGLIDAGRDWVVSPQEVALVMELPLRALVESYAPRPITRRGLTFDTDTYVVGDHLIWGATARILGELLGHLRPLLAAGGSAQS
jgi:8-oxo-dGTP pyrophosphatase MutT (NUDIX family)